MFKKVLALLVGCVMAFSNVLGVFATDANEGKEQTQIICSGDVEKISIRVIPAESYNGTICVYVVKDEVAIEDITPETVSDVIVAIKELKAVDGDYSATLPLKDEVEAGWYRAVVTDYLYAAPLWNETDIEKRSVRFYLADMNIVYGALSALNDADQNNINSLIKDEYSKVLNIELPLDYVKIESKIAQYLVLERKHTYENSFKSVDDVKNAYETAIFYARMATQTSDELKELMDTEGGKLVEGFADDFAEFEDEAIRVFTEIRDSADVNKAPAEEMTLLLREATAVAALNKSSRADISGIIDEYNDVLKFDLEGNFRKVNSTEVYKALSRMGFNSAEDAQKAFDAKVTELLKKKENTGGGGGGGGGFGGGFSSGNTEYVFVENNKGENVNSSVNNQMFADMSQADWAKEYVEYLVERKIVNGDGTGNFKPNARVTREEFVKMIVLALDLYDEDASADFDDVDENEWYYPYIASAVKSGIIRGIDERNFGVGKSITRQDIAVIAHRVYKMKGNEVKISENTQNFADYDTIADYAKESVVAMRDAGIINGFEDNTFMPADFATRAQAAKIIYVLTEEVIGL